MLGLCDGEMVSVVILYSDELSSNPAKEYGFSVKFVFEKTENKQKNRGWWRKETSKTNDKFIGDVRHFYTVK